MAGIKINLRKAILLKDKNRTFYEIKGKDSSGVNFSWQSPIVFGFNSSLDGTTLEVVVVGGLADIYWGDGTSDLGTTGTVSHNYPNPLMYYTAYVRFDGDVRVEVTSDGVQGVESYYGSSIISKFSSSNLTSVPVNLPKNITGLSEAFSGCNSFNQDISSWDVSNVTDMNSMFRFATDFNQDISSWDVSNVTDMNSMFRSATDFNQDISSWDVSNVTDMYGMFLNATSFNQDISSWDMSSLVGDGQWYIFNGASSFNQDLSSLNISSLTSMRYWFDNSGMSTENYSRTLIGWANQHFSGNAQDNVQLGAVAITYNNTAYTTGNQFNDAVSARSYLVNTAGWTITDGGQV